ncbi:putative nuclease HARBI1, partial [Aphis craccivora]
MSFKLLVSIFSNFLKCCIAKQKLSGIEMLAIIYSLTMFRLFVTSVAIIDYKYISMNRGVLRHRKNGGGRSGELKSKEYLYSSFLRPVLTYGCETWSVTKGDEEKLNIFERKVLRRIYGP